MASAFDRATELVARQLASFRLGLDCDDPHAFTKDEELMAGHIVGNLWANNLLNTGDEKWVSVSSAAGKNGEGERINNNGGL
jgi:hypothetical protein